MIKNPNKTLFSFEVFPPKKTMSIDTVYNTLDELKDLKPDFISVTYGAGGSENCENTLNIAKQIKNVCGVESVVHMPCINMTKQDAEYVLTQFKDAGIENILALRGDGIEGRKPSDDFIWGIELKETKEIIGMIEVFDIENERFGMVGYRIAPWLWNKGFCTESMERIIEFIFAETKLDRLQGNADVRNIGSNKVFEKCGFKLEGTIRHGKMASNYCDYNIWGLIRDDII